MWSIDGGPVKNRVARMSALLCDYPHVEAQNREQKDGMTEANGLTTRRRMKYHLGSYSAAVY